MGKPNFKYAVIDLDLPVFKAAATGQKTIYHLKDEHGEHLNTFQNAKDCKAHIQEAEEFLGLDTSNWVRESELVIKDYQGCQDSLVYAINNYLKLVGAEQSICTIGGEGNFRDDLAKIKKYKGQRKTEKPHHFKQLREWAIKEYNPQISSGVESDDLISMILYKDFQKSMKVKSKSVGEYVMIDLEKDCRTTPGWHFDPKIDEEPIWISRLEANRWVYTQSLAGDSADNYGGCKGIGMVKAKEALSECKTSQELYSVSLELYRSVYGDEHSFETWEGDDVTWKVEKVLEENLRLAYMLRTGDWENEWVKQLGLGYEHT